MLCSIINCFIADIILTVISQIKCISLLHNFINCYITDVMYNRVNQVNVSIVSMLCYFRLLNTLNF